MAIAVDKLAKQLHVDPGDVRVVAAWIAGEPLDEDILPKKISGEVRHVLDPRQERTRPHRYR